MSYVPLLAFQRLRVAGEHMTALEVIQQKGWIQLAYDSPNGVCLSRALTITYPTWSEYDHAYRKLRKLLGGVELVEWNDYPGRTKEEVLAVLQEAGV